MKRQEVVQRFQAHAAEIRERFSVRDLSLFGSTARGEARDCSDLDVLVTFQDKPDFDRFMGLKLYLEDVFGVRVDLVTPAALRSEMRPQIEREAIHVA